MSTKAQLSIDVDFPGPRGGVKKRTVPFKNLNEVPIGILRTNRNDVYAQAASIVEWALSPEDLEHLDTLPSTKFWDIFRDMQKASNVDLGESSASSES
jgi:hypothetical protein